PLVTAVRPLRRSRGADVAHVVALPAEIDRRVSPQAAGSLDAPSDHGPEAEHPGLQGTMPVPRHVVMAGGDDAAPLVDHRGRPGVPVGVNPDHVAPLSAPVAAITSALRVIGCAEDR